jgi:hypothetical protein
MKAKFVQETLNEFAKEKMMYGDDEVEMKTAPKKPKKTKKTKEQEEDETKQKVKRAQGDVDECDAKK